MSVEYSDNGNTDMGVSTVHILEIAKMYPLIRNIRDKQFDVIMNYREFIN